MRWFGYHFGLARLVLGLPVFVTHAVDVFARVGARKLHAPGLGGILVPVGQAVPAKARQVHQVQVLHIGALAQMLHQPPEGGGFQFRLGFRVGLHWP